MRPPATAPARASRVGPKAEVVLLNKPYGVLCQFTDERGRATLAHYVGIAGVYPAGRLDADSEGLVVLTADGRLQARIAAPRAKLPKVYWVQVEGTAQAGHVRALAQGLILSDGRCAPARARVVDEPRALWPRDPPIRVRRAIPTSWLEITLTEGRNRQVRRMTAAVGLPTLRLIRYAVGPWTIDGLEPGRYRRLAVDARML